MAKRLAGIAVAAFAIVLSLSPLFSSAANAAADCLSAPTSASASGQRWHYRLEDGHRCWYLKSVAQRQPQAATADMPASAPSKVDAWPDVPRPNAVADAKPPAPTPDTSAVQSAAPPEQAEQPAATPWPQPTAQEQPLDAVPDAPATAADAPVTTEDTLTTADTVASSVPSDGAKSAEPEKPEVEIRMLLLAIVCALGFSGLLASTLFSLARFRQKRRQRDANWRAGIANTRRWQAVPVQDNLPAHAGASQKRVIGA